MMHASRYAKWSAMVLLLAGGAAFGAGSGGLPLPKPSRVAAIEQMLPERPVGVGPPIGDRAAWEQLAALEPYRQLVARAEKIAAEPVTPQPESLFLLFTEKGDRASWEKVAFKRRGNFAVLVFAECLQNQGKFLPKIKEYVEALCAEPTWMYSAHDSKLLNFHRKQVDIDLGQSTLGWQMATAAWLLGDKLDAATRDLIQQNLQRRVIEPMLARYTGKEKPFWWQKTEMNWNTVCLAGVTGTALAAVQDRHTRALFAAAAELYSNYYFKGIPADGYCSEGLGYWNYGFGRFTMLSETLRQATHGQLDLLKRPDAKRLARFGARLQIINGVAPAFADSPVYPKPDANLMYYLNRVFQLGLAAYDQPPAPRPLMNLYLDLDMEALFHFPNAATDAPVPASAPYSLRDWFDKAGILISRPAPKSACRVGVALKGGTNNENHNHNDVGSYVFVVGDKCLVLDPGAEHYTARTFSPRRYESNLLNSFGHDVPMVAGKLQRTGAAARAKVVKTEFTDEADTLTLDITSAYPVPELEKLTRTWVYSRAGTGSLTVTDHAVFKSPQSFGTALITLGKWTQADASHLTIVDGKERCEAEITASGPIAVEPTVIRENASVTPTRLGVNLKEKGTEATITIRLTPK